MPRAPSPSEKQAYRKQVRESIAAMDDASRGALSAKACARVASMGEFASAKTLLAYRPIKGECSPDALVALARAAGKRVAFPRCEDGGSLALYLAEGDEDFTTGAYGILEPDPARCRSVAIGEIDIAVVPGMAFDVSCNRLGRGAGYYDRLLQGFRGVKAGLAYQCQIFASLPADAHDVSMDFVVTNNGIIVKNPQ